VLHRLSQAITNWSGRRGLIFLLALATATGGVVAIIWAISSQQSAPVPPASAAGTVITSALAPSHPAKSHHGGATGNPNKGSTGPAPVAASVPTTIDIPSIAVHSAVVPIGKASDGTLAVPQPGPDLNKAAWYKQSVTPGQQGPSVIEGHIDSVYGPSIFYKLGALRPGDKITVTRRDHSVVHFTVDGVRSYASHADFPTAVVYGSELNRSTLRLITCSNFDSSIGHYVGNTVVFAHLTAIHSAA
jgi:sortase (surface protein transpeptidase)